MLPEIARPLLRTDSRRVRLAVAVVAAALAIAMGLVLGPLSGAAGIWLCFVAGVVASAWYGGFKPGIITTILLVADGLYLAQWASTALFAGLALAICAALRALRMERRKAQATERRLHDVLESSQDAVLSIDAEFRIRYANARAAKIGKREAAQLCGRSLRTVFAETPAVPTYRELGRALRDNVAVHFEHRTEGRQECYEFRADPVPGGLNIFVRDVTSTRAAETERARLTREIESERSRLEAVLREMPVGVIIASLEGRVELVNQAASDLFGVAIEPGEDVLASRQGVLRRLNGELLDSGNWPILRTLRTGEAVPNQEAEYERPDGAVVALMISSIPLAGPDGKLRGALGTYSDVNSMREMQNALRTSEVRLRRLFESPIIGVVSGREDRILEANDAFLQMLGYTREEMTTQGLTWTDLTPAEFIDADLRAIRQLTERGFSDPFEKEYRAKDGRRIPVLVGVAAYEQGSWSPWIAWLLDISEHRRLEERLRQTAKLESIGLLAGGVAHDFNNILTGILGNASLALETLRGDDALRGLVENVIQSSERASDLTRQLLAYAGKGRVFVRPVDVSQLAREIGQLIRTSIPRNVELDLELGGDLPVVEADGTQIEQLLMNLVINAAEAIGDRPGTVRVKTSVRQIDKRWLLASEKDGELPEGEYVQIEVTDTGCGMDEATVKRIFDPFFTTKFTGRGLGLAAATGIVRGHQGVIRVRSSPGLGSTFDVLLPVSKAAIPGPSPVERLDQRAAGSGTILVVDDEEMVRQVARASLERCGYTVLLAAHGREALDIFRGLSHSISMVILDMTMPVMGGEETMQHMITIDSGVRILLTSGFDEAETVPRVSANATGGTGLAGFIQKPYTAMTLAAKVRAVLDR